MMDRGFIEKVAELAQGAAGIQTISVDDVVYATKALVPLPPQRAASRRLATLSGIVTYVTANPDGLDRPIVHIADHENVHVFSSLDATHRDREFYISAKPIVEPFRFGEFMPTEPFIIALLSRFVQTDHTATVLRLVGNIKDENVKTFADDGVTQQVTARAGIARVEEVAVPQRVTLAPYRTFVEIEQPPSEFVLRLKQGREGEAPQAALFESDGGAWRREAMESILSYLKERLPEGTVIIA